MKHGHARKLPVLGVGAGLAAGGVFLPLAVGPRAGADAATRPCPSPKVKVLAKGREAALYRRGDEGDFVYYMCRRDTGRRSILGVQVPNGDYWFPPPAIAVAGPYAAYAQDVYDVDTGEDTRGTGILLVDTRARGDAFRLVVRGKAPATARRQYVKVGSLALRRTGAIAWVECPVIGRLRVGDPRPNCVRAGLSVNRVYKRDSNTPQGDATTDLLDEGTEIDPTSLRLRGATVSWTHDGKRRTAPLAGANFTNCTPTPTIPIEPPCPPGATKRGVDHLP